MTLPHRSSVPAVLVVLAALAVSTLNGGSAQAGTIPGIAPDYRGDPNSIFALFTWAEGADWNLDVYDTVSAGYPLDEHTPGISQTDHDLNIVMPNFIDELDEKLVRINFLFEAPVDGSLIQITATGHDPLTTTASEIFRTTGASHEHYIDFLITPNPDWEEFLIVANLAAQIFPGNLVTITIDTVSRVPEPGSAALLGLGLAGLSRIRRRRVR